jgi:hypothetical protein
MEKISLYVLIDPLTLRVRYIGRTKVSLAMRLSQHVFRAKNNKHRTHKHNWIVSLLRKNCRPYIRRLCIVDGWSESHVLERLLIAKYRDRLVNHDDRGEGGKNKQLTDEYKESIAKTLKEGYADGSIPHPRNKRVYCYDRQGNYLSEHKSVKQSAADLSVSWSSAKKHVQGKRIHVSGYRLLLQRVDSIAPLDEKICATLDRDIQVHNTSIKLEGHQ